MKVAKLTITDGLSVKTLFHHPGVHQPWDISLCGQDLIGDRLDSESWGRAEEVFGRVNCPDCVAIIAACRKIKKSDFVCSK